MVKNGHEMQILLMFYSDSLNLHISRGMDFVIMMVP